MSEYRENKILHEMTQLYIMFCMPRITVNKTTGEIISIEYIWNNKEAEKSYGNLAELLLFERQAFQQSMHPTRGSRGEKVSSKSKKVVKPARG